MLLKTFKTGAAWRTNERRVDRISWFHWLCFSYCFVDSVTSSVDCRGGGGGWYVVIIITGEEMATNLWVWRMLKGRGWFGGGLWKNKNPHSLEHLRWVWQNNGMPIFSSRRCVSLAWSLETCQVSIANYLLYLSTCPTQLICHSRSLAYCINWPSLCSRPNTN